MKIKFTILVIILIILIGVFTRPSDDEKYRILNEIIADDSLNMYRLCYKFKKAPIYEEAMNEFSWYDQITIYSQKLIQFDLKIKPNRLKYLPKSSKTKKKEFIELNKNCNEGLLTHISLPIISYNKQKVLLKITEDCNCMLGGQRETVLYEKKNGIWERVRLFDRQISFKSEQKQQQVTNVLRYFPAHTGDTRSANYSR